ncbi:DUF2537 domain-containing protein [Pseudonocardia acaciae]|uniref:DUF2537 domain-containing protein n=1 Tax=Pseudonocardia acaciae TaxID=551276 RepID=UPI0012EEC726|nr:DUF2537 domain-containing protein [Pseudonocardia acaciae]
MRVVDGELDEPTPWATGLTASAIIAVLIATIDMILSRALQISFGWVWIPANVLIGAGLAPSILLLRRMPFWRWIAYGVAAGLVAAWFILIVTAVL